MIFWIFDMDDTIYRLDGKFDYNRLEEDPELSETIKKLPGMKVLFTNGTHMHTINVLKAMKLNSVFDLILDRDVLGTVKPDPKAFQILIKLCSIKKNDVCYYFEDSVYNLIVGYSLGWQTILIGDNNPDFTDKLLSVIIKQNGISVQKSATINYSFKNIRNAINHFINRLP
uniref:Haloacid dehalogenase-like hydrolase n=1 Tax=viral metagenome TaxID=1070528 RepID=A0A6C0E8Y8_9ZZZZ